LTALRYQVQAAFHYDQTISSHPFGLPANHKTGTRQKTQKQTEAYDGQCDSLISLDRKVEDQHSGTNKLKRKSEAPPLLSI